jgi:hypothetical protein
MPSAHPTSTLRGRAAVAVAIVFLLVACDGDADPFAPLATLGQDEGIPGSGVRASEDRAVAGFERVTLAGEGRVVVEFGDDESLTIETDDNLLQYIESSVVDGRLELRTTPGIDIAPSESVEYRIVATELTGLELAGVGSIEVGTWEAGPAEVLLTGVGDVTVDDLAADDLAVELSGVGMIFLGGDVGSQEVVAAGVGSYEAAQLRSTRAVVEARDDGTATVWATEQLEVTTAGLGRVTFYGPAAVAEQVEGSASITYVGDR